jgi:hypothetical protein
MAASSKVGSRNGPLSRSGDDQMTREILLVSSGLGPRELATTLPVNLQLRVVTGSALLAALKERSVLAALVYADADTASLREELKRLREAGVALPVVLLLPAAAASRAAAPFDCVALAKAGAALWPAVRRASIQTMFSQAVYEVRRTIGRETAVGRAVESALGADPPFKSVRQLAAYVGCDPATLYIGWRQCMIRRPNFTLHEFLDVVLLLRSLEKKSNNIGWRVLARRFDVSIGRLRRTASWLVGMSLHELEVKDPLVVLSAFEGTFAFPSD